MALLTEDIISAEHAGTLDGLLCERVRRTPDIMAYRSYDSASRSWIDTTWGEVGREVPHAIDAAVVRRECDLHGQGPP